MSAPHELTATLRFSCPACRAELAVPFQMAGIEGPCPSCYQNIRAPLTGPVPEVPLAPPEWHGRDAPILPAPAWPPPTRPVFPPAQEQAPVFPVNERSRESEVAPAKIRPLPPLGKVTQMVQGGFPLAAQDRQFQARRAIPTADEPLDDSWKDRARNQRRSSRRSRRAEHVAHGLLESRGFRFARVALILLSGAMLAWLFHYLQNHQWRFPGLSPAVAEESPGAPQGKVRPVGADANELTASDDDTEIPPASETMPSPPLGRVAGPPR